MRYRFNQRGYSFSIIGKGSVLYPLEDGEQAGVLFLNELATVTLNAVIGGVDLEGLSDTIAQHYGVSSCKVLDDMSECIDVLLGAEALFCAE